MSVVWFHSAWRSFVQISQQCTNRFADKQILTLIFSSQEHHILKWQAETSLRRSNIELSDEARDLERVNQTVQQVQKEVKEMIEQKGALLAGLDNLRDEKTAVEKEQKDAEEIIRRLKR